MDKSKREQLLFILQGWEAYNPDMTLEENLVELIIAMGFLDEAQMILERYQRRRYK